jgi:hypothetical protein
MDLLVANKWRDSLQRVVNAAAVRAGVGAAADAKRQ